MKGTCKSCGETNVEVIDGICEICWYVDCLVEMMIDMEEYEHA